MFDVNCIYTKHRVYYFLNFFSRAASLNSHVSSVWKLLGDACTLLYPVPSSLAPFTVPAKMYKKEMESLADTVEVTKQEVLEMGAR